MRVLATAVAVAAAVAVLAVVIVLVATAAWGRATSRHLARLESGRRAPEGLGAPDAPGLPPPVRRYLERSLPGGAAPVAMATLVQEGTFQMGEGDAGWKPFRATQRMRAYPPGFLWDASIAMAPLLPVRVRDGYLDGRGMMKAAIACLITVAEGAPTRELAEGSLYRYLGEAVWMPNRLLPGDGLSWEAVDDATARATLRDGTLEVSVLFGFDDAGDIVSMLVPERGREVEGRYLPTPWKGRLWDHQVVDGYRIPLQGEVAWVVDGVKIPYWRGRIASATYR